MARTGGQTIRLLIIPSGKGLLILYLVWAACAAESPDSEVCHVVTSTGRRALLQKEQGVLLTGSSKEQDVSLHEVDVVDASQPAVSARPHSQSSRSPQPAPCQVGPPGVHHEKLSKNQSVQQNYFLAAVQYEAEVLDIPMPVVRHKKDRTPLLLKGWSKSVSFWPCILLLILLILLILILLILFCLRPPKKRMTGQRGIVNRDPANPPLLVESRSVLSPATQTASGVDVMHAKLLKTLQSDQSTSRHISVRLGTSSIQLSPFQAWHGLNSIPQTNGKRAFIFTVRSMHASRLEEASSFQYVDEATEQPVLRATVTVSERVDDNGTIVGSPPAGQRVTPREHPSISMHSMLPPIHNENGEDNGPCFLQCRPSDWSKDGRKYFFYDAYGRIVANLSREGHIDSNESRGRVLQNPPRYRLISTSLGQQFAFECFPDERRVRVWSSRGEELASTEPVPVQSVTTSGELDPTAQFYRIIFYAEVLEAFVLEARVENPWHIFVLVLEALMVVAIERGVLVPIG